MKAAVLAGGRGTRLRPLTLHTPKGLLPVAGVPILRHQVERLHAAGIEEIAVCTRPDAGIDWEAFAQELPEGARIEPVPEPAPLGTGGALRALLPWLDGARLFAVNGDDLTDADPRELVRAHEEAGADCTLGLRPVGEEGALSEDDADPTVYGNLRLDEDGRITAFLEKPTPAEATGLINAGQYVIDPGALEAMPAGRPFSIEREGFPGLLAEGRHLHGCVEGEYHRPVNTPAQLLQVHRDLYRGRWRPPWLPSAEGRNQIGRNCKIWPEADLGANVTLGDGCEIGPGAVLEDVLVLQGTRIGPGAHVASSVIGTRCRIGHHARIRASALGAGVWIPPWTSLGDLEPGRRGEEAT